MSKFSKPRTRAGVPDTRAYVQADIYSSRKSGDINGPAMFLFGAAWALLMFPAFLVGVKYIIHDVSWLYNWLIG